MRSYRHVGLTVLMAVALLAGLRCGENVASNGGTGTGNGNVAAMLRNPGGSPAAHAKVMFVPVDHNPRTGLSKALAAVDSTTTDSNGNYHATLDTGTYNVLASGDSGLAFQDSITTVKDSTVRPPDDTLGAPGAVRGVVRLEPRDDSRTVFMLFMGTQTWIAPDDSIGNFRLANMAAGKYHVRILTVLDNYAVMDTSLSVTAGRDSVLADTIRLRFMGIPVPTGLVAQWDSALFVAGLHWQALDTTTVAGYNVYRGRVGAGMGSSPINATVVPVAFFSDSACSSGVAYYYAIRAIGRSGEQSLTYSNFDTLTALGTWQRASGFALAALYPDNITPLAIAAHRFFAVNGVDTSIDVYDTAGGLALNFGHSGAGRLLNPRSVKTANGYLYVMELDTGGVWGGTIVFKKFSLSGQFIKSDSVEGIPDVGFPGNCADFAVSPSEVYFYDDTYFIHRFGPGESRDSVPSPITQYPGAQSISMSGQTILFAAGLRNIAMSACTTQIALLNEDLSTKRIISNGICYNASAMDSAGNLFVVSGNSKVTIYATDMTVKGCFPLPYDDYRDIAIDSDGSMFLYAYEGRVTYYRKR